MNQEGVREQEPQLRKIDQIDPKTGLSEDYLNEFNAVISTINFFKDGGLPLKKVVEQIDSWTQLKGGKLIRNYEERYSPDKFIPPAITEENRDGVRQLNFLADSSNKAVSSIYENQTLSSEERVLAIGNLFEETHTRARRIISPIIAEKAAA